MHVRSFRTRWFFRVALGLLPLTGVVHSTPLNEPLRVPEWAFPLNPPAPANPPPLDSVKTLAKIARLHPHPPQPVRVIPDLLRDHVDNPQLTL